MNFDSDTKVADIAVGNPATIRVFQHHGIDFCCGGKLPLSEACASRGLDPNAILDDLRAAQADEDRPHPVLGGGLAELAAYIQHRYHQPLRQELPRLGAMLAKVAERHGERLPETIPALQRTFDALHQDLLDHMAREDAVLFPLIAELEATAPNSAAVQRTWIRQIVDRMEAEHEVAGAALQRMRELTDGYVAPDWACPTLIGLYHGLANLERDMQVHVHLENAILFPRSAGENVTTPG